MSIGGGVEGNKWESKAELMPGGVSCSGKEGKLGGCLPVTGAPCREVNSKVTTAPNNQSRRYR